MQRHTPRSSAWTLHEAAGESPVLARLGSLARLSGQCLQDIRPLLPAPLRTQLQPGPIDQQEWCILVPSSAMASKLRQMLPELEAHLRTKGHPIASIRIKVTASGRA
jgi:hypothetical protein